MRVVVGQEEHVDNYENQLQGGAGGDIQHVVTEKVQFPYERPH